MRKSCQKQMPLTDISPDHPRAFELQRIGRILDENPIINQMVLQDITHRVTSRTTGAEGMTAEQVFRAAIIKQMEGFSYKELAFHLIDSRSYKNFCRIGFTHNGYKKSALCKNIKSISPETWEAAGKVLVDYAKLNKIEKCAESRIDCTVVSSNIHHPTDSSLLWDSVRVLTRMLNQAKEQFKGLRFQFTDHTRRAKRRALGIMNAKNQEQRKERYRDLLKITHETVKYAKSATALLDEHSAVDILAQPASEKFKEIITLSSKVIDQTERRVLHGQSVPASEKIVSIFEPHTDIIVKDRRDTFYGHKVCLSVGKSNLITDCLILDGNPADSELTIKMLDRHKAISGRYPLKVALDGGFASKDNLKVAKGKGIKDVCFSKGRGLQIEDMCRSEYVFKRLRRFRAGVESAISWIKRSFGLATCTWKSLRSFKSYVWASIVSANLVTLARSQRT
jgi:transposase, IS5 family